MSCTVSCGNSVCSGCDAENNQDLHSLLIQILDKFIRKEVIDQEEDVTMICQYVTQNDYTSLCKLGSLFLELEKDGRKTDFFLLLKMFLKHQVFGVLVAYALEYLADAPITNSFCCCYAYRDPASDAQPSMLKELELLIIHVNMQLETYLVFNPNASLNKAVYQ